MAAISQVTKIFGSSATAIDLTAHAEQTIELGTNLHTLYFIAAKGTVSTSDTIELDKVKDIVFEITIDSGISGKTATIRRIVLPLVPNGISEYDDKSILSCRQELNLPTKFYIRPVAIELKDNTVIKKGTLSSLDVFINPVQLGVN